MGVPIHVGLGGPGRPGAREPRRRALRGLSLAFAAAALALVALPTGASADPRVPPPACPPAVSLQAVERAPGGVILLGAVTAADPSTGRVRLEVLRWYHRSFVPGLEPGEHPAAVDVMLGPGGSASGRVAVSHLPRVGSHVVVGGSWLHRNRGIGVACGIFANANLRVGTAWLERAEARYAAIDPTPDGAFALTREPWLLLLLAAAALAAAASVFSAIAEARDPLPAT